MMPESWVESANAAGCDFPLENLPYGVFLRGGEWRIGVAIGDQVLDLRACLERGLIEWAACGADSLNALMSLGGGVWGPLRARLTELLARGPGQGDAAGCLVPMEGARMGVPARVGDYTDFYASAYHASRVGAMLRPEQPLLPNYKHVPIGYHGRASSIVVSGTGVRRPWGQTKGSAGPKFGPTDALDYELEMGCFVGPGNPLGEPVKIAEADGQMFGLCLLNDWSARDVQAWEYQPLGPFLAKSFATSVSPWVVTLEALEPYRVEARERERGDPVALPYLDGPGAAAFDITLEVWLFSRGMREKGGLPIRVSRGNFREMYWTWAQLFAHHASNGCNLRPGDLLGSGTVSGAEPESRGCLLEMTARGAEPLLLPGGDQRTFLEDGDEVIFRGWCERPGLARVGFGECRGMVLPAVSVHG